jgi:hypothetical protein
MSEWVRLPHLDPRINGSAHCTCNWPKQSDAGARRGSSRNFRTIRLGQSLTGFAVTQWLRPGNTNWYALARPRAADRALEAGVAGSYSPESSSVGIVLRTGSRSIGPPAGTDQILHAASSVKSLAAPRSQPNRSSAARNRAALAKGVVSRQANE